MKKETQTINVHEDEKGNMGLVCNDCIEQEKKDFKNANHKITKGSFLKYRFVNEQHRLSESMWVRVSKLVDIDTFEGVLMNHPAFMPNMKHGMLVEINLDGCWGFIPVP